MNKFLKLIFISVVLLLVLMFSFTSLIYNINIDAYEYYEEEEVLNKLDFFRENNLNYNTIFIGSSKVYRQVNPHLFDSLSNRNNKSFNLAYANLRPFRSLDLLERVRESENLEYIFLELGTLSRIYGNYNTKPNIYSISFFKYRIACSFSLMSNYPLKYKVYYFFKYTQLFFYKYLGFGLKEYIDLLIHKPNLELSKPIYNIGEASGYLPLDKELDIHDNANLVERKNKFLNNPEGIIKQQKTEALTAKYLSKEETDFYIDYLNNITTQLKKEGKKVFFIVSPRHKRDDLRYIKHLKSKVNCQVFDLSDPIEFPEHYSVHNTFDESHLNSIGAEAYTKNLVNFFNEYHE